MGSSPLASLSIVKKLFSVSTMGNSYTMHQEEEELEERSTEGLE